MLRAVNTWEDQAAARLLEFFDPRTQWHRSLWNPGLILMLREALEASEAVRNSVLSEASLALITSSAVSTASADKGIPNNHLLGALSDALPSKLRYKSLDYNALEQICATIEKQYLVSWATHIAGAKADENPERVARSIAAHLLDRGFSASYLHRWWRYQIIHDTTGSSFSEIVARAQALADVGYRQYDVLVIFDRVTAAKMGRPNGWLEPQGVTAWLTGNCFSTADIRPDGGVVLKVEALDAEAARDAATETIQGLIARSRIATLTELSALPFVWIAKERNQPFAMSERNRGVSMRALVRENVVYQKSSNEDGVDAAFEMLAALQRGSPVAAIAGGWAAIEALLSESSDRGSAAERLAFLVACSYPRAELTALSYALQQSDPALKAILDPVTDNRQRCDLLVQEFLRGVPMTTANASDDAAVARMRRLLAKPVAVLHDVQTYAGWAFSRMYRQRNLILHWGKTDAVAIRACLRTSAALVGAGMDRIAHGYYVQKTSPLATAARARVALKVLGSARSAAAVVDLLP